MLASIHQLDAEAVLVEGDTSDLFAVRSDDGHGFVFLGKFLGGLDQTLRQPSAGVANGFDDVANGTGAADPGQIRPEAAAFAFHHVTSGTIGVPIEELLAVLGVARLHRSLDLDTS